MSTSLEALEEQLRHQRRVAEGLDGRARAAAKEHNEAVIAVKELEQRIQVKRDQAVEVVTAGEMRGLRALRDATRAYVTARTFVDVPAMTDTEIADWLTHNARRL